MMRDTVNPVWMRDEQAPRPVEAPKRRDGLMRCLGILVRRCTVRNERLQVCETISLGGRRSVALIECDGQRFLAGLSASGVEMLVPVIAAGPRGGAQ